MKHDQNESGIEFGTKFGSIYSEMHELRGVNEPMITKKQSVMIQGIAVLLMMYHHFFLNPSELALSYGNVELVKSTAWFGKICVGMFAFVSGYGIYYGLSALQNEKFLTALQLSYRSILLRLLRLFGKYWYVLLVFKAIDFGIRKEPFYPAEFWKNFFAIEVSYNGTWWYMQQYVLMMLLVPLVHLLFEPFETKERRIKSTFYGVVFGVGIVVCSLLWLQDPEGFLAFIHELRPSFLAIFFVGYLFSRFSVYKKISEKLSIEKISRDKISIEKLSIEKMSGILNAVIGLVLIAAMIGLRIRITPDPSFARYDFVIVPIFVTGVLLLFEQVKVLAAVSLFVGNYATYMWLIHTFLLAYTEKLCMQYISGFFLFYLVQVGITLCVAWLMKQGELVTVKKIVPYFRKKWKNKSHAEITKNNLQNEKHSATITTEK